MYCVTSCKFKVLPRNHFIDLLKLVAAFFVICIHTNTTAKIDGFEQGSFSFIIDNIARFAVPFFFITSGYLINFKNNTKLYKRLAIIFVTYLLWCGVFILIRRYNDLNYPVFVFAEDHSLNTTINRIYKLFVFGYERHLWFFPAYIIGVLLVKVLHQHMKLLASVAIVLYVLGVTGQQLRFIYPDHVNFLLQPVQQWLQETQFTRDGLFLAFPMIALGNILSRQNIKTTQSTLPFLITLSIGLTIAQYYECLYFINNHGAKVSEYYLTTPLLVTSILLIGISKPYIGIKLRRITRLSGGVYLLHPLFMYLLLIKYNHLFQMEWFPYLYTLLLFGLSLLTAWILSLIKPLRPLIFYQ